MSDESKDPFIDALDFSRYFPQLPDGLARSIFDMEEAEQAAGISEGGSVADLGTRGRPSRIESGTRSILSNTELSNLRLGGVLRRLDEATGVYDNLRSITDLGHSQLAMYNEFEKLISSLGEGVGVTQDMIKSMFGVLDYNQDGVVSAIEVNRAASDKNVLERLDRINPLLSKIVSDKQFRIRTIPRKVVAPISTSIPSNQVELVRQSYAAYNSDVNAFNVDYST